MTGPVLRAGAWPAVAGVTGVAVAVGGCGAAFPAAATMLFPICFALLAAAAAFTLDEPASLVVDVTPTTPARRTTIRAVALLAPLTAGALVMLAAAIRGLALPWTATGLALAGNVLLGFAAACVARTRTGEPGATAWRRRRAGTDGAQPRTADRTLGPHVPGARRRRAVLGSCVVDRPRGMRGGHHHLGRRPQPAPVDIQYSVIPATTIPAIPTAQVGDAGQVQGGGGAAVRTCSRRSGVP